MVGTADAPRHRAPFAFFKSEAPAADDGLMKGSGGGGAAEGAGGKWASGDGSEVGGEMIWNESIASALGYGKNGRPGAAFQWWILALAAATCVGSFIAWAVLVVRGRDATEAAMNTLGVYFPWWDDIKALLVATAVLYPVFVLAAILVSAWRAYLAKTLDIHRPDAKWLANSRRFQGLCAAANTLLWLITLIVVFSVAGHAVWGYLAQVMEIVGSQAVQLVGPVWGSVSKIADSGKNLSDRVTGMLESLPSIGRKLMEDGGAGGAGDAAGAAAGATVGELLAAAGGGGGGRALQQANSPLLAGLGQLASGIANGISAAASLIPSTIPGLPSNITIPGLPTLLPNGSSNPLVGAITDITNTIEQQILSPNGCPIYCIDLRAQRWWRDASAGCFCNMDRVEAALPHLNTAWRNIIPSVIALIFMYIGASWLLMHGASQWARTRSEAKLMGRIPGAAAAQAAAENAAAKAASTAAGGGEPAPLAHV